MATTTLIAATTAAATGDFAVAGVPQTIGIFSADQINEGAGQINERAGMSLWIQDGTNYVHAQEQDGTKIVINQAQRNYCIRWPGTYQLRKSPTVGTIGAYRNDGT